MLRSLAIFVFLAVSREELLKHVARLQGTLDRERDERNFYQLERDRMDTFWEVTRGELGETRAEVRGKDRSGGQECWLMIGFKTMSN